MMTFMDGNLVNARDSWSGVPGPASADEIEHPELRRLYSIWEEKRGGRRFPAQRDIGPRDLAFMLSRIALVEIRRDPLHFFWRIVGGWWRDQFGVEGTGMRVDEWPSPTQRAMLLQSYRAVTVSESPCRHVRNQSADGKLLRYEALLLPLGEDDVMKMFLVGVGAG
jgi:hypothetical protein